jgi:hypothetical protein
MITLPSVLQYKGIAVYPDDKDPNLYFAFQTYPQISMRDEVPVFSGLFWTDQANGDDNSVAGLQGGLINFDVNLAVSPKLQKEIAAELKRLDIQKIRRKELIKIEKERLSFISKARGDAKPPEPDIPPITDIRFGAVSFTEGTVNLMEEQGGDLIPWSSTGGPASLIGDNNAAFALRLSPEGAAVWYKSLKDDAKAFSIRYALKFMLRIPSLEIRAWAGSSQKFEMQRKVERVWKNVDKGCSDADVERIDEKEIREVLMEEGLVNIEVNKGSTVISDEHVSQLRNLAMELIDQKIKEIIKTRVHGMTEEQRKTSMLEVITQEVSSFVEIRFAQSDVIEWEISPQGTIMEFLADVPSDAKKRITKLVDLSEHEVETIEIPISVSAPWEEEPNVNAVKVNCNYPSAGKTYSKTFTKDTFGDTWRFRRPRRDDGKLIYNTEIFFNGISAPLVTDEETTNGALNVHVGKAGVIDTVFKPHPMLASLMGDNKVLNTQVELSYKSEGEEGHFVSSLVIPTEKIDGVHFKRLLGKKIDAPVEFGVKYFTKGGEVIEMPPLKYYISENNTVNITTPNPFENRMDLDVEIAIFPNKSLKKIIVEFRYEDKANNFESSDKVELSAEDEWESVKAKLVQRNADHKDFQYRYKIIGQDSIGRSAWIEASGEQTIVPPILAVQINASRLKIGEKYSMAILEMKYENEKDSHTTEFFLNGPPTGPLSWFVPRSTMGSSEYTYNLTLFPLSGPKQTVEGLKGSGKFVIIEDPNA